MAMLSIERDNYLGEKHLFRKDEEYILEAEKNLEGWYVDFLICYNVLALGGVDYDEGRIERCAQYSMAHKFFLDAIRMDDSGGRVLMLKRALSHLEHASNSNRIVTPWIYYQLSKCSAEHERLQYLESCISIEPRYYSACMDYVEYLDFETNTAEINQILNPLISEFRTIDLYNYLGSLYFHLLKYDIAQDFFVKSLSLGSSADGHYGVARLLELSGIDGDATSYHFSESLILDWSSQVAIDYAWFLYRCGRVSQSEEIFMKAFIKENSIEIMDQIVLFYISLKARNKVNEWSDKLAEHNFRREAIIVALVVLELPQISFTSRVERMVEDYNSKYIDSPEALFYLERIIEVLDFEAE